jgi:hypothetical protein
MSEIDDRLAGDPVWEIFPHQAAGVPQRDGVARFGRWLAVACAVVACWVLAPPLAVLLACLAIAVPEFRNGLRLARSIPDKAGRIVCARFTHAWGAWKLGLTALPFVFATILLGGHKQGEVPPGFLASVLLFTSGYSLSAILTAAGLVRAYRSGMRVWVGKGVNQARTLVLGMLIVGFTVAVLGPLCVWFVVGVPRANQAEAIVPLIAMLSLMFVGPVVMLIVLDSVCRRVVADHPGNFDAKVPMVGKWDSQATK